MVPACCPGGTGDCATGASEAPAVDAETDTIDKILRTKRHVGTVIGTGFATESLDHHFMGNTCLRATAQCRHLLGHRRRCHWECTSGNWFPGSRCRCPTGGARAIGNVVEAAVAKGKGDIDKLINVAQVDRQREAQLQAGLGAVGAS